MSEAPTLNMMDFDPHDLAIEDIDVSQRSLWIEDKKMAFFDRLRDEAPVHYCKDLNSTLLVRNAIQRHYGSRR